MRKIAITGIRKAAQSVGNYLGRKSLKVVARANRTADKAADAIGRGVARATDATANLVRKAANLENKYVYGPVGKATRDASAKVIKATRSARPRARETMGQIARRKGWVNPVYKPKERMTDMYRRDRRKMNINFRDESARPSGGDYMSNVRPPRGQNMREIPDYRHEEAYKTLKSYNDSMPMPKLDSNFRSYVKSSGPKYTDKQIRAGRKVALGAQALGATGYVASEYYKAKKANR